MTARAKCVPNVQKFSQECRNWGTDNRARAKNVIGRQRDSGTMGGRKISKGRWKGRRKGKRKGGQAVGGGKGLRSGTSKKGKALLTFGNSGKVPRWSSPLNADVSKAYLVRSRDVQKPPNEKRERASFRKNWPAQRRLRMHN